MLFHVLFLDFWARTRLRGIHRRLSGLTLGYRSLLGQALRGQGLCHWRSQGWILLLVIQLFLLCIVHLWVYHTMLLWIIVCLWMGPTGSVVLSRSNSSWEVVWSRGLVHILLVPRVILGHMTSGWNRWCWLLLGGLLYSSRVLIRWLGWGILERWLGWNSTSHWFRFWDTIFNMMFMAYF